MVEEPYKCGNMSVKYHNWPVINPLRSKVNSNVNYIKISTFQTVLIKFVEI